jgi:hypothetical protein
VTGGEVTAQDAVMVVRETAPTQLSLNVHLGQVRDWGPGQFSGVNRRVLLLLTRNLVVVMVMVVVVVVVGVLEVDADITSGEKQKKWVI